MRLHTRDRTASVSSQASIPAAVKQVSVPAPVIEKLPEVKTVLPSSLTADTPPILILFGSNTGTSEEAAYQLAHLAKKEGFKTSAVAPLDSYIDKLGHGKPQQTLIPLAHINLKQSPCLCSLLLLPPTTERHPTMPASSTSGWTSLLPLALTCLRAPSSLFSELATHNGSPTKHSRTR